MKSLQKHLSSGYLTSNTSRTNEQKPWREISFIGPSGICSSRTEQTASSHYSPSRNHFPFRLHQHPGKHPATLKRITVGPSTCINCTIPGMRITLRKQTLPPRKCSVDKQSPSGGIPIYRENRDEAFLTSFRHVNLLYMCVDLRRIERGEQRVT